MVRSKIKRMAVLLIVLSVLLSILAIGSLARQQNFCKNGEGDPDDPDGDPDEPLTKSGSFRQQYCEKKVFGDGDPDNPDQC